MKDRVSKYPGRVLMTPDDGSAPFYATMQRADEPTQPGDPLSKATLLQDDTAALFGLDETAVPDLVFQQIPDAIGTIKTTVRADMPENWLLCNGASVRAEGYDGLAAVLVDTWPKQAFDKLFDTDGNIAYENGTWVKCQLDSNRQIVVYFKNELTEPWSQVETGITLNTQRTLGSIYYTGGRWLIRIGHVNTGSYTGGLSMCAAENIAGPWKFSTVYSYSNRLASTGKIVFADGYYAVPYVISDDDIPAKAFLYIVYTDDSGFTAGTWTTTSYLRTQENSRGNACSAQLFFGDGKWILQSNLVARDSSGDYTVPNRALQMVESLTEAWSDIPSPGVMSGLEHINGRWEATLAADHSRACTDELTSGWTIKSEQWGLAKVQGYIVERGIEFTSGANATFQYRALGQAYQTNNASTGLLTITTTSLSPVACIDGEIFFSNGSQVGRLPPGFVLPAIATDGAYTYIKANEGADR